MKRQAGKVSLGLLCLVAGSLWLAYKYQYVQLFIPAMGRGASNGVDMEQGLLLFILSPGIVLILAGIVMIIRSMLSRSRPPSGPVPT